jgi:hypothetical protein
MGKELKNLIGEKFGAWTVMDFAPSISNNRAWKCKCDCGTKKDVFQRYLLNGKSKSCGCIKINKGKKRRNELLNKRFGKLTVIEILPYGPKDRISYVKCLCDCGNEIIVDSYSVRKIKSCLECCHTVDSCIGQKFGKLTIVEMLYHYKAQGLTYCKCLCKCGNNNYITKFSGLKSGNTSSCGCVHSPSLLNQKFGRLTVISEVETDVPQRLWECECECGEIRYINSYILTSGHTNSCGCLRSESVSKREVLIKSFLNEKNIQHQTQKTFEDCRGIGGKVLRFDFYLPQYNYLIEYDGEQHFKSIEYFGGIKSFEVLRMHDNIKNVFCNNNNINLMRLPYTLSNSEIKNKINNIVFENPATIIVV